MSERMIFCLGDSQYETKGEGYQKNNRIFNVQVTKDEWDAAKRTLPELKIALTKWIDKKDMTAQEKKDKSGWDTMGGYLKRFEYKEAWAVWWATASDETRKAILGLPHFSSDIFEKITGIKVDAQIPHLTPPEIVIDGATYILKSAHPNKNGEG
jgi:hypothetical protein